MVNMRFYESFEGASTLFQPHRISDHSLAVLRVPMTSVTKPRPFKFSNLLVHNTRFKDIVWNGWNYEVSGFWMYKVVKRLKILMKPLRKLLYDQSNILKKVKHLRHELDEVQRALDSDPTNKDLREDEAAYLQAFNDATLVEEHFLRQKEKVKWLKLGDSNTAYFHKVVKSQASRNHIDSVMAANGVFVDGLSIDVANHMVLAVTDQEIWDAIFSMGNDKAPGSDGYSVVFFKEAWDIIAQDVIKDIKEFFVSGVLLKELNHTIIALIPKVDTLMMINDYRPISCCNVLYKCITAIQKAYDTVDSEFLRSVLVGCGFHPSLIGWIMECVTSTSFLLSINGILHGYFKGKRCLHQGDPMSSYLFTLVIEVLTLMLDRRVRVSDGFTYHRYCSKLNIINLCFADDLFLFAHGDVSSAHVIMDTLEEFKNASGLTPSLPKSTAYFCNVLNYVKTNILSILSFEEGFQISFKVSELIVNGNWVWPNDWSVKFLSISTLNIPLFFPNTLDGLCWKNLSNVDSGFSVVAAWDCIRPRDVPSSLEALGFSPQFVFLMTIDYYFSWLKVRLWADLIGVGIEFALGYVYSEECQLVSLVEWHVTRGLVVVQVLLEVDVVPDAVVLLPLLN
nr:hypothetical protein [Tanacetum cinerariifolium]